MAGALSKSPPTFTRVGAGQYRNSATGKIVNSRINPGNVKKAQNADKAKNTKPAPTDGNTEKPATFDTVTQQGNEGLADQFDQIQKQGAFNPGSFQDTQKEAQNNAFNAFQEEYQPLFQQQNDSFLAQQAASGNPANAEGYQKGKNNLLRSQYNTTAAAQNQAYQAGLGAQAQAYGQAYQTHETPYVNTQYFNPQYQQQGQEKLQGSQIQGQKDISAMNNATALQQSHISAGAGLQGIQANIQAQYGLQSNEFAQQMALYAQQLGYGNGQNAGNSAINGIAQGAGAAIGASLR